MVRSSLRLVVSPGVRRPCMPKRSPNCRGPSSTNPAARFLMEVTATQTNTGASRFVITDATGA